MGCELHRLDWDRGEKKESGHASTFSTAANYGLPGQFAPNESRENQQRERSGQPKIRDRCGEKWCGGGARDGNGGWIRCVDAGPGGGGPRQGLIGENEPSDSGTPATFTSPRHGSGTSVGISLTHFVLDILGLKNYFTKAALIVLHARFSLPPAYARGSETKRVNKWVSETSGLINDLEASVESIPTDVGCSSTSNWMRRISRVKISGYGEIVTQWITAPRR